MSTRARRRILGWAAFCILLGGLTTLGFAWGAGAYVQVPNRMEQARQSGLSEREWWLVGEIRAFATRRYVSTVMIRAEQYTERDDGLELPDWARMPAPAVTNSYRNDHYEISQAHGFPLPAAYFTLSAKGRPQTGRDATVRGAIELEPWETGGWYDPRALAYRPLWFGLIGDVAFWTALWAAIIFTPILIRRGRRKRRGLCVDCGYNISGTTSDRCPECGARVGRRAQLTAVDDRREPAAESANQ